MEAADVVVMNDDLRRIAETVQLSRSTHVVLWQNITLALGIKAVFLVLAVFGSATMWMAIFADMGPVSWWWATGFGCSKKGEGGMTPGSVLGAALEGAVCECSSPPAACRGGHPVAMRDEQMPMPRPCIYPTRFRASARQ